MAEVSPFHQFVNLAGKMNRAFSGDFCAIAKFITVYLVLLEIILYICFGKYALH